MNHFTWLTQQESLNVFQSQRREINLQQKEMVKKRLMLLYTLVDFVLYVNSVIEICFVSN